MEPCIRYNSSYRSVSLDTTLIRARSLASRLGISRVTDITRLDTIGVPVFASIRPGADQGSLCVNAGKGLTAMEARVGAYMEAIEFALAEHGASHLSCFPVPAGEVLGGVRDDAILDLCPVRGREFSPAEPIACVQAEELVSGTTCPVPAELVFLPCPRSLVGTGYFGAHSNGLCSGNSVLEATVHGLAEVIERDIGSFQFIHDSSILVDNASLPGPARNMAASIEQAGLHLHVRYQPNPFEIPYFSAHIIDPEVQSPIYVNGGYGCHPHRSVALVRAIAEAAQSRLSFIHGGRDDLADRHAIFHGRPDTAIAAHYQAMIAPIIRNDQVMAFNAAADPGAQLDDIEGVYAWMAATLTRDGIEQICRVRFTRPDDPLQVLKIIVPGLEFFDPATSRVGPRLARFIESRAGHHRCVDRGVDA